MAGRVTPEQLTPAQVEMFAKGLYFLSAVDGADDSELLLLKKFLAQAGYKGTIRALAEGTFDPAAAAHVLDSEPLRKAFLRAGVELLRADGDISDEEFDALRDIAGAFELKSILLALLSESSGGSFF